MATYASVPPFVRAVARTFTRAVRSLCRGLPERLLDRKVLKEHPGPSKLADLRVPFHAAKTIACALRIGTGQENKYSYLGIKSKLIPEAVN